MNKILRLALIPAPVLAAPSGRDDAKTDDALNNHLALASQAQPFNAQQFTSPTEMGYAYNPYTGQFQPVPQQPGMYPQTQAPVVQRVSTRPATVRRTSSGTSSGTRVI